MPACQNSLRYPQTTAQVVLVAAMLAMAVAPVSAATYFAETHANAIAGSGAGAIMLPDQDLINGETAGSITSSSQVQVGTSSNGALASGESIARVATGVVHAYAAQSALIISGTPTIYSYYSIGSVGTAKAEFNDVFMLDAAGYAPGTVAMLTFSIVVSGSVDGYASINQVLGGYGFGSFASDWHATTTVNYDTFEQVRNAGGSTVSNLILTGSGPTGVFTGTARVLLGQLNPVMLRAEASALGSGVSDEYRPSSLELRSLGDLGHTLGWGGIVSLSTPEGVAITNFTAFSSNTGFDYMQAAAVPEPQSWALMSCGLLFLGVSVLRRKSSITRRPIS